MAAELHVWLAGRESTLSGDRETTLGRSSSSDLRSSNPLVSRHHALIRYQGGHWVLRDVGSSGGTYVGNRRVPRVDVVEPVSVRLGDPQGGEVLRLTPVGGTEAHRGTTSGLSDPVRMALAAVIVVAAGFVTTRLLKVALPEVPANEVLANLGFTWMSAFSIVDDMLERRRISLRFRRWGRARTDGAAPILPTYKVIAYGTGVLTGTMQVGGFIGGLSYFIRYPEAESATAPMYASAIAAGCIALYVLGTWFGRRLGASSGRTLFLVAVLAATLDATLDVVWGGGEVNPLVMLQYLVVWAPLWVLFAWCFGLVGIRRGQADNAVPVSP